MKITVHHNPGIKWQGKRISQFVKGLKALGFDVLATTSLKRLNANPCVVFGTSMFREIEASHGDCMLVDRASFGDPDYVQLVWNGRLRNGNHMVPDDYLDRPRWQPELQPEQQGTKRILCGQFSNNGADIELIDWYKSRVDDATHFKPHPAVQHIPTLGLPIVESFDDCEIAYTLNSSVAIDLLISGVNFTVDDASGMAYDCATGDKSRGETLAWLSWTQFSWAEIEKGKPIEHLFGWLT